MSNTFFGLRKCSLCSASICKRRKNLKQQCHNVKFRQLTKNSQLQMQRCFNMFQPLVDVSRYFVMFCVVSWFKMIHSLSLCCASCATDMSVFTFWLKSLSFRKGSCWILNVPPWISFRMQWLWSTILMSLVFFGVQNRLCWWKAPPNFSFWKKLVHLNFQSDKYQPSLKAGTLDKQGGPRDNSDKHR